MQKDQIICKKFKTIMLFEKKMYLQKNAKDQVIWKIK